MDEVRFKGNVNEAWARVVDLPGLDDNVSPHNHISTLFRLVVHEVTTKIFLSLRMLALALIADLLKTSVNVINNAKIH